MQVHFKHHHYHQICSYIKNMAIITIVISGIYIANKHEFMNIYTTEGNELGITPLGVFPPKYELILFTCV